MSEFNNRISAQRDILFIVNSVKWNEELFGLSAGAIERWKSSNQVKANSQLLDLIMEAAKKLFFLSNKSQEQITKEYRALSQEVFELTEKIRIAVSLL